MIELLYIQKYNYPAISRISWHKCLLSAVIAQKKWARGADKASCKLGNFKPNWIEHTKIVIKDEDGNRSDIPAKELSVAYNAYDALPQKYK